VKDIKKNIWILLVLLSFSTAIKAQVSDPNQWLSAGQLKNFAKNADRLGDAYTAIDYMEKYCKIKPRDYEMGFRLAELYRISRNYQKAADQYAKIYKNAADKHPVAIFYQAQMLKSLGKYEEAKEAFSKSLRKIKDIRSETITSAVIKDEMKGCDMALTIMSNPIKISTDHLNSTVNKPHIEFSPIPFSDSILIYGSLKLDSINKFKRDETGPLPVRQFYVAKKVGNDWIGGSSFSDAIHTPKVETINTPGVETGNGAFSKDGKRFYFTRCGKNWQNKMKCEIYMSEKIGDSWGVPQRLNDQINHPDYTATQPAVGLTSKSNLDILYFVSDRPGGRGGMDIWYSIYTPSKKTFSSPRNCGVKINTAGDEITPFYEHATRTLYFSSSGLSGLGGLDIFRAMGELRKWYTPKNMGYPLNSSYDELYFTTSKSREEGFFTSNRPGGEALHNPTCCDDIYHFRWTDFIRLDVTGQVFPSESKQYGPKKDYNDFNTMKANDSIKPMKGAIIGLYMIDNDTKEKVFIDRDTTGEDGKYHFDLLPDKNYKFEMEGFQYFNEQVYLSTEMITFSFTIEMPPIWVNVITDKPIVLRNVYYAFDDATLSDLGKKSIDSTLFELMQKAPDLIVEVGSHTDSLGNFEYNKKLSQQRADNVISYLVSKGIEKKRLTAVGYGAEKPVANNFNPDGSDYPEGREKNRRTEFRVIGTLSSKTDDIDVGEDTN
jgi:outer membrane protein OmpA-like peptidoglycan-associated protein